ncbi:MAG: SDR family oxidoreductase [Bacteroidales bacterium]|nr:SDR family oxidoreductase [Bacteroidales bacterium]
MDSSFKDPFTLEGKKILVTGASSGIGKQCAVQCSYSGANVIIFGRDADRLQDTFEKLKAGDHRKVIVDVCDRNALDSAISEVLQHYGSIDGMVYSVGLEHSLPFNFIKLEDYQTLFSVNVFAGFEICRLLLKKRGLNKNSSLVFISSILSKVANPGLVAYCASKGAIESGVRALALELVPNKIRVNTVLPGVCKTSMTDKFFDKLPEERVKDIIKLHPLGLGEPEDIAHAAVFLLSGASKWITGSSLVVDGGYSIH